MKAIKSLILRKEFEEKYNQPYTKYRLQAPSMWEVEEMLDTDNRKLFCRLQPILYSMSSLSQNDQQNFVSHWLIALLSE